MAADAVASALHRARLLAEIRPAAASGPQLEPAIGIARLLQSYVPPTGQQSASNNNVALGGSSRQEGRMTPGIVCVAGMWRIAALSPMTDLPEEADEGEVVDEFGLLRFQRVVVEALAQSNFADDSEQRKWYAAVRELRALAHALDCGMRTMPDSMHALQRDIKETLSDFVIADLIARSLGSGVEAVLTGGPTMLVEFLTSNDFDSGDTESTPSLRFLEATFFVRCAHEIQETPFTEILTLFHAVAQYCRVPSSVAAGREGLRRCVGGSARDAMIIVRNVVGRMQRGEHVSESEIKKTVARVEAAAVAFSQREYAEGADLLDHHTRMLPVTAPLSVVPEVFLLQMLHAMRRREYLGAVRFLHEYVDYSSSGSMHHYAGCGSANSAASLSEPPFRASVGMDDPLNPELLLVAAGVDGEANTATALAMHQAGAQARAAANAPGALGARGVGAVAAARSVLANSSVHSLPLLQEAALHFHFGNVAAGRMAVSDAVRAAQEHGDAASFARAMSWLSYAGSSLTAVVDTQSSIATSDIQHAATSVTGSLRLPELETRMKLEAPARAQAMRRWRNPPTEVFQNTDEALWRALGMSGLHHAVASVPSGAAGGTARLPPSAVASVAKEAWLQRSQAIAVHGGKDMAALALRLREVHESPQRPSLKSKSTRPDVESLCLQAVRYAWDNDEVHCREALDRALAGQGDDGIALMPDASRSVIWSRSAALSALYLSRHRSDWIGSRRAHAHVRACSTPELGTSLRIPTRELLALGLPVDAEEALERGDFGEAAQLARSAISASQTDYALLSALLVKARAHIQAQDIVGAVPSLLQLLSRLSLQVGEGLEGMRCDAWLLLADTELAWNRPKRALAVLHDNVMPVAVLAGSSYVCRAALVSARISLEIKKQCGDADVELITALHLVSKCFAAESWENVRSSPARADSYLSLVYFQARLYDALMQPVERDRAAVRFFRLQTDLENFRSNTSKEILPLQAATITLSHIVPSPPAMDIDVSASH